MTGGCAKMGKHGPWLLDLSPTSYVPWSLSEVLLNGKNNAHFTGLWELRGINVFGCAQMYLLESHMRKVKKCLPDEDQHNDLKQQNMFLKLVSISPAMLMFILSKCGVEEKEKRSLLLRLIALKNVDWKTQIWPWYFCFWKHLLSSNSTPTVLTWQIQRALHKTSLFGGWEEPEDGCTEHSQHREVCMQCKCWS